MYKKGTVIILSGLAIIFLCNICVSQQLPENNIVSRFVVDQFDTKLDAKKVVESYIELESSGRNLLPLDKRFETAKNILIEARNGKGSKGTWIIPDYSIRKIEKPVILPYSKSKHLSKLCIDINKNFEKNVFVLLNEDKNEILQYFLLNNDHNKILSFSLLVKAKDSAWFFVY